MKTKITKEIKKTPKIAALTFVLLVTILITFVGAIVRHNWRLMLLSLVIGALLFLPRIVERWSTVAIPDALEVYIIVFLYASFFLGELKHYYTKFWWWDVALHTSSGVALGIVGFLILYVLYKSERIKSSPKTIALFSFTFAVALGALWEIVEFTIDSVFHTTYMQGIGIKDTMSDLIVDSLGALFSACMGYLYIKRESGIVVKPIAKEFKKDNQKYFKKRKSK